MFILSMISGYSILLAAIIGLVRFRNIHKSFQPFVIICLLSLLNEIISSICAYIFKDNSINYTIYSIVEAVLYMWMFRLWGHFRKKRSYVFTIGFLLVVWLTDSFIFHSFRDINSLFLLIYSFCLIFLAIDQINILVMTRRDQLIRDSRFLICMAMLIFYSYTATISVFYLFKLNFSNSFYLNVYFVLQAVNFLTNLVFALALLWSPKKLKFILPF